MRLPEDQIRYVDLPGVSETFADSLGLMTFDGQTARIEFCVQRADTPKPSSKPTARKYPACRMVLSPDAFLDLYNQLQNFGNLLKQQGIISDMPPVKKEPVN